MYTTINISNSITNKLSDDVATTTTSEIEYMNNTNESFFATAVNNFAIVSLHLKCIKEAVRYLEDLIEENPTLYLIDPIIFNLCTMYDLICAPAISTQKKKAIQIIANYYDIEDPILHWRCFRLSSGNDTHTTTTKKKSFGLFVCRSKLTVPPTELCICSYKIPTTLCKLSWVLKLDFHYITFLFQYPPIEHHLTRHKMNNVEQKHH